MTRVTTSRSGRFNFLTQGHRGAVARSERLTSRSQWPGAIH